MIAPQKSFCAMLWHILCLPVAHKSFCAVLWHILCLPVARKFKSLKSLKVKNCKSRIASQELQVKNCKTKSFGQFGHFFLAAL
jgi:hypothetical protein